MILPRLYDHVYNPARADVGKMPHGYVIQIPKARWDVEKEDRECIVRYFRPLPIFSQADPEFGLEGGDVDSITFRDFEDYKVSSAGQSFPDYRGGEYGTDVDDGTVSVDRKACGQDELRTSVPVSDDGLEHAVPGRDGMVGPIGRATSPLATGGALKVRRLQLRR